MFFPLKHPFQNHAHSGAPSEPKHDRADTEASPRKYTEITQNTMNKHINNPHSSEEKTLISKTNNLGISEFLEFKR